MTDKTIDENAKPETAAPDSHLPESRSRETNCTHVYDELQEPQNVDVPREHPLWPEILTAMKEVYDPEIPVNVYELGLIYAVYIAEEKDGVADIDIKMTLTSPGCPVAQEMPGWVQGAVLPIKGVGEVDVEIVWEPTWNASMMSETAKMQLNMFM